METEIRPFQLTDPEDDSWILRGRIESPAGAESSDRQFPAVLILHGFKGFMDWGFFPLLSHRIAHAGMVAVSFNMSSSGIGEDLQNFTDEEGFARNTFSGQLEDTQRVREFLVRGPLGWVDPERCALFGHSMGGGVALLHAAERGDYRAVATWASISTVERYDPETVARWKETGHLVVHNARTGQDLRLGTSILEDVEANREELDILAAAGRLRMPTLVIHGGADESVPLAEGQALSRALSPSVGTYHEVPDAGHTFGARHPLSEIPTPLEEVLSRTLAHFSRHLGTAGSQLEL